MIGSSSKAKYSVTPIRNNTKRINLNQLSDFSQNLRYSIDKMEEEARSKSLERIHNQLKKQMVKIPKSEENEDEGPEVGLMLNDELQTKRFILELNIEKKLLIQKIRKLNDTLNEVVNDYDLVMRSKSNCPKSDEQFKQIPFSKQMKYLDQSIINANIEKDFMTLILLLDANKELEDLTVTKERIVNPEYRKNLSIKNEILNLKIKSISKELNEKKNKLRKTEEKVSKTENSNQSFKDYDRVKINLAILEEQSEQATDMIEELKTKQQESISKSQLCLQKLEEMVNVGKSLGMEFIDTDNIK